MGQKSPGVSAAVVTPNMAPAIVPGLPSLSQQQDIVKPLSVSRGGPTLNLSRIPLPTIPANLASPQQPGSPTPRGVGLHLAATPSTTAYAKPVSSVDYFSSRTPKSDAEDADASDPTPGASTLPSGLKTPDATNSQLSTPGPVTPGGGLIGRLKNLGRGAAPPKRLLTPEDTASPAPATEEVEVVEESVTVCIFLGCSALGGPWLIFHSRWSGKSCEIEFPVPRFPAGAEIAVSYSPRCPTSHTSGGDNDHDL